MQEHLRVFTAKLTPVRNQASPTQSPLLSMVEQTKLRGLFQLSASQDQGQTAYHLGRVWSPSSVTPANKEALSTIPGVTGYLDSKKGEPRKACVCPPPSAIFR